MTLREVDSIMCNLMVIPICIANKRHSETQRRVTRNEMELFTLLHSTILELKTIAT